jgi:hypothetical protein
LPWRVLVLLACLEAASSFLHPITNHHSKRTMDKASQVLAQGVPAGMPKSFRALADHGDVPCTTLQPRTCKRSMHDYRPCSRTLKKKNDEETYSAGPPRRAEY